MWKKIGVALIALIGTCSVVYAVNNNFLVAEISNLSDAGGAPGKINIGPNGIANVGFKKGDQFYSGTVNPLTENPLSWKILNQQTYTNYKSGSCTPSLNVNCNNTEVTAFVAASNEPIARTKMGITLSEYDYGFQSDENGYMEMKFLKYSSTLIAGKMEELNASMSTSDQIMLAPRNVTYEKSVIDNAKESSDVWEAHYPANQYLVSVFKYNGEQGKSFFTIHNRLPQGLEVADLVFTEPYWTTNGASDYSDGSRYIYGQGAYISEDGSPKAVEDLATSETAYAVRPFAYFDPSKIVFGINETGPVMKVRYLDDDLSAGTNFYSIKNSKDKEITKASVDSTVKLDAQAVSGGKNTVSALVFNAAGEFLYYKPLAPANGADKYSFDLTGIPIGHYQIAIVNEEYDKTVKSAAASSAISSLKPLEIVEEMTIKYEPKAESYTYNENVISGSAVGDVIFEKGVATYDAEIIADPSDPTSYLNFELANTTDIAAKTSVLIKADGPSIMEKTKSLKAGTYKFCIIGSDYNGDPLDKDGNRKAKVCVSLEVKKAELEIKFNKEDKGTTIVYGGNETVSHSEAATHTNKDLDDDVGIVYSFVSGTSGLISSGLPYTSQNKGDTANLSITPKKTGKVIIQAEIPESENYKKATTTKTIEVKLKMSAEYKMDITNIKAGSDNAKPSSNAISHIEASNGTSPYSYELKTGVKDNGSFKIDSTGKIYINNSVGDEGLSPGTYEIEVEVTDSASPKAQTITVTGTITVLAADLSGVSFENPDKAGDAVSEIVRTFDPIESGDFFQTKLMETTKDSLKDTEISYSVENSDVLEYVEKDANGNAKFKVKKGMGEAGGTTAYIIAQVTGGKYGTSPKEVKIPVIINPYEQEIEFAQEKPYSLVNTAGCTSIPATKKSTYWNQSDSNPIKYEVNASDSSKVSVENGKICPVSGKTGTVTVTATLAGDDSYKKASATITINLVNELTGGYSATQKNIVAGSDAAKPSTESKIGAFTAKGGTSTYKFITKDGTNDNAKFTVNENGDVFVSENAGENGLEPGTYTIEVTVIDSTKPTALKKDLKAEIVIGVGALSAEFEDPDKPDTGAGESITREFDPSTTPEGGTFHTKLLEITKDALKNTDISYSVEGDAVIEYTGMNGHYAEFKVNTVGETEIKAHVTGGVYGDEGVDITIPVSVEKYSQEIQFEQENPYPLENTSGCVAISATQKSDYWNVSAKHKITYESGDKNIVTVNDNGNICPVAGKTGTVTVTATLAGDDNYKDATATIIINLLGELKLKYEEGTPLKQAVNPDKTDDIGNAKEEAVFGPISVSGGIEKEYNIQIKSGDYAFPYFELSTISDNKRAKNLKLKSGVSITADILKKGIIKGVIEQDTTNKDQYNWKIKVLPDTEPQEIIVHIIGADPILTFEKEVEGKLTTTYEKDGTIDLSVKRGDSVMDTGISVEGTVGYATYIKSLAGFTTDAQLNGTGIIKSNCDDDDQVLTGKDFKLTPKAEASDGYKSGTGTATPVIIKKADHPDVDFVDPNTILSSYIQSVDKGFTGILTDDEHLEITPQGESTWSGTEFIKYNKGDTTEPSVTITPNGFEGTITYIVNGGGTANYKPIKNKEIHLAFAAEGGISYKPIKITYGDDTKKVIDYISDADKAKNTYTYAPVEGNTYVNDEGEELFTLDDSTSTITTIHVGKTKVNVKRTDENGNVITQAIPVEIIKKEITLTYESNTIYTGEALPTPAFKEPDAGVLVGNDTIADFPIPNEAEYYDGTEVLIDSETTGTYDTKGNWTNDELTTEVNPNYKVTIKAGKLTIKKDTVKDNWYHLEGPDGKTVSKTAWHNYLVDVVLDTATGTAGTYDQISNTKTFTDTNKTRFTVTNEDENKEDVYFRIDPDSEAEHKGAITSTQTTVKIDMTKPNVTKITGYPVNTDGLSELIHNLTFGMFFKPGVEITIETEDPQPSGETGITVSGVHTVSYKVYKLGEKGEFDPTQTPKIDEGKVDANGKISFKINDVGNYRVCAIAKDNATNPSNESCSDVNVKKVNVDIDGDGTNDFVDSDDNGCPDLNIILGNDSDGNPVKLNVAEKNKTYPYMNIDSDGDGKPDLNIDTDHDGKPDLNLVILTEKDWVPKKCVVVDKLKDYTDPIEYCTGTDAKAVINVDTDGNGIPNINIDTDGDMKPDINIDTNNDGEANTNINTIESWVPKKDCIADGFPYDTMGDLEGYLNVDSNGDGYPDINIDLDGDGIADINIDTDNDGIPNVDIDSTGDGKPDTNIDTNGDGKPNEKIVDLTEWKPNKIIKGDVPYGTMDLVGEKELADGGIIVEKPDGSFLPNTLIKVDDISNTLDEATKSELEKVIEDQEIKKVYDIDYVQGNSSKQPDGKVIVKVPVDPEIKNPKIVVEKEDGSFEEVKVTEKDGYYVFETEYIGKISILGDVEENKEPASDPSTTPDPEPTTTPDPSSNKPSTSVMGNYTQSKDDGIGGAITGDVTNISFYTIGIGISLGMLFLITYKRKGKE